MISASPSSAGRKSKHNPIDAQTPHYWLTASCEVFFASLAVFIVKINHHFFYDFKVECWGRTVIAL